MKKLWLVIIIFCGLILWQGSEIIIKVRKMSALKAQYAEMREELNEKKKESSSPALSFPQIVFVESVEGGDLLSAPQRHDITVAEMKKVEKDVPLEKFTIQFGGVHGSAGSGFVRFYYFLEEGMYASIMTGSAEYADGIAYDAIISLYIGDSTDPNNGFVIF